MIYKHSIIKCVQTIQWLAMKSEELSDIGRVPLGKVDLWYETQDEIDWCYVALYAMLSDEEKQFAMQGEVIEILMLHECKTGTVTGTACDCCISWYCNRNSL